MPGGGNKQSDASKLCQEACEEAYKESVKIRFEELVSFLLDAQDNEDEKDEYKAIFKKEMALCREAMDTGN